MHGATGAIVMPDERLPEGAAKAATWRRPPCPLRKETLGAARRLFLMVALARRTRFLSSRKPCCKKLRKVAERHLAHNWHGRTPRAGRVPLRLLAPCCMRDKPI